MWRPRDIGEGKHGPGGDDEGARRERAPWWPDQPVLTGDSGPWLISKTEWEMASPRGVEPLSPP